MMSGHMSCHHTSFIHCELFTHYHCTCHVEPTTFVTVLPSAFLTKLKSHGVRQGCVLAPDSFATDVDWLLERTVDTGSAGVSFGPHSFSDLDFADDVAHTRRRRRKSRMCLLHRFTTF